MSSNATDPPEIRPPGPPAPDPSRNIINRAVRWAIASGLRVVASDSPGIHCTSTATCTWEADPHFDGVSPLGAAVLHRQALGTMPATANIDSAEWLAVGETKMWTEGFAAGIAGQPPNPKWTRHPSGPIAASGYLCGRDFFNAANLVTCPSHPSIRHLRDEECRRCAAEVSDATLTPIDPNAGRH